MSIIGGQSYNSEMLAAIYKAFISKMNNTLCKNFLNNRTILENKLDDKGVDANMSFRGTLKACAFHNVRVLCMCATSIEPRLMAYSIII